jgi:hypothetical protein
LSVLLREPVVVDLALRLKVVENSDRFGFADILHHLPPESILVHVATVEQEEAVRPVGAAVVD